MDDFDFLISKYSDDLIKMKEKWSKWGIVTKEKKAVPELYPAEEMPEEPAEVLEEEGSEPHTEDSPDEEPLPEEETSPDEASDSDEAEISSYPTAAPESYATFTARVFSGQEAYPVESAKVMIYKNHNLHTFLITDQNGETPTVKIESAPAENALIPNSENQETDYSADVFADGFTPRKNLLVSAVGDSHILLRVQLTPLSERID